MLKIISIFIRDISLLKPREVARNVAQIDYERLKRKGINYLVYDKDNTLTRQDEYEYFNKEIEEGISRAKKIFGAENIAILSNARNIKDLEQCKPKLGIPHVISVGRKPFNHIDVASHFKITSNDMSQVCMIGDRLMTDILIANLSGMYAFYTYPLEETSDLLSVKPLRIVEDLLLKYKFGFKRE